MKRVLTILGGLLTIVSVFLVFSKSEIIDLTGIEYCKTHGTGAIAEKLAYIYIGCGAIIIIAALVGTRGLTILNVLLGLGILAMAIKYYMDIKAEPANPAMGLWFMMAGGALAVLGAALGLVKKKM